MTVDERAARQVAEQARETRWQRPSFGKELFLGHFRIDLIHPHPSGTAEDRERGEAFLEKLREFTESHIDNTVIERDALEPQAARVVVASIVRSGDPLPRYERKRLDDDEVRAWIQSFLAASPEGTKSAALSEFRESGRACEQSRFGRLFEETAR